VDVVGDSAYERLLEVDEYIQRRANRYSFGDVMLAEDLLQEGREAAWKYLQVNRDCPESHLVVEARDAMLKYKGKGKSVDGKLLSTRQRNYHVVSFDVPTIGGSSLYDMVGADIHPVETIAIQNVDFDRFCERLDEQEKQTLAFLLYGYEAGFGEVVGLRRKAREYYEIDGFEQPG